MTSQTRNRRTPEISSDCTDIPAGWPRAYYMKDGKRTYTQWSSGRASEQIFNCDADRTWRAAKNHLCSSCGEQMEKGLIFDREWVKEQAASMSVTPSSVGGGSMSKLSDVDTHYGSPICFRCSLFALKHCPYFSAFAEVFGDEFTWIVITGPEQYCEIDYSSGLEVLDPSTRERLTTADVKATVQRGELHLTGRTADQFGDERRPAHGMDTWAPDESTDHTD